MVKCNVDIASPWPWFSNMGIFLITFFDRLFLSLLFHVTNIFFSIAFFFSTSKNHFSFFFFLAFQIAFER